MQYNVIPSTRFQKDLKRVQKRGGNIQAIADVIKTLAAGEILERKYKDHPLSGNYAHCRECHVEPDLLLVYRYVEDGLLLYLVRTGTHSDLF